MLNSRQRRYLKSLAHHLNPTVRIGRARLSPGLVAETNRALEAHELIKVKIEMEGTAGRGPIAKSLASATAANIVGTVGKIAILYRPRSEEPTIQLPT